MSIGLITVNFNMRGTSGTGASGTGIDEPKGGEKMFIQDDTITTTLSPSKLPTKCWNCGEKL